MKRYIASAALLFLLTIQAKAQLGIQLGAGYASPITGYSTISDGGLLLQADITKRLKKHNHWGFGLTMAWAKFHQDNNSSDKFMNARLDQVPIMIHADYEIVRFVLIPYVGLGMGASLYNLTYDTSPTSTESVTNVSFSMMPRLGVRFKLLFLQPFLEVNFPVVFDGPPEGAGDSGKATGYVGYLAGLGFRF
jgi:hypothetical protein